MPRKNNYDDEDLDSKTTNDMLLHAIEMMGWSRVDVMDPAQVKRRVMEYLKHCEKNEMKPTVEGLAFAFDISRAMLQKYAQGAVQGMPQECSEWFRRGYDVVGTQLMDYMYNGKINTVAGIFIAKNNLGYEDRTVTYVESNDSLGALQDRTELLKRIAGSVGAEPGELSGTEQPSTHRQDGEGQDHTSDWEIDGRTPEAFMDLLDEADTE